MDGFKVLVGAACAAIIAAVGYYFWTEWQKSVMRGELEKQAFMKGACVRAVEQDLPNMKKFCLENGFITREEAERGGPQTEAMRSKCQVVAEDLALYNSGRSMEHHHVGNIDDAERDCRQLGLLPKS